MDLSWESTRFAVIIKAPHCPDPFGPLTTSPLFLVSKRPSCEGAAERSSAWGAVAEWSEALHCENQIFQVCPPPPACAIFKMGQLSKLFIAVT